MNKVKISITIDKELFKKLVSLSSITYRSGSVSRLINYILLKYFKEFQNED